ncbi:MAG: hypothetical protein ABJC28_04400 [Acidobacteriota bacterium]
MSDPEDGAPPPPAPAPESAPTPPRSEAGSPGGRKPPRPNLSVERSAVTHDHAGYTFRLEPTDLANLRELPGARGRTDEELGAEFLLAHGDRLAAAIADDLPAASRVRVLVDPYSRQAFLAVEDRVRGIVSF